MNNWLQEFREEVYLVCVLYVNQITEEVYCVVLSTFYILQKEYIDCTFSQYYRLVIHFLLYDSLELMPNFSTNMACDFQTIDSYKCQKWRYHKRAICHTFQEIRRTIHNIFFKTYVSTF